MQADEERKIYRGNAVFIAESSGRTFGIFRLSKDLGAEEGVNDIFRMMFELSSLEILIVCVCSVN